MECGRGVGCFYPVPGGVEALRSLINTTKGIDVMKPKVVKPAKKGKALAGKIKRQQT